MSLRDSQKKQAQGSQSSSEGYCWVVHKLALLLTIAVFPLIWVGGLVTTYDAGMAVPDWPGTYGWNMFAYPASTWLFGPFDLLVEHSHRLLGTVAGFLSIGLVIAAYRWETRSWFRHWSIWVLLAVIAQGALGGARVLLDQRTFAMIHGCTGPLFFAMATATAVMSSRWWFEWGGRTAWDDSTNENLPPDSESADSEDRTTDAEDRKRVSEDIRPKPLAQTAVGQYATGATIAWLATIAGVLSYCQLIMGAQLRHVTGLVSTRVFKGFVHSHLGLAGLVLIVTLSLALAAWARPKTPPRVRRATQLLALIVFAQIALGIGTWIVNYALPWPEWNAWLANYTLVAKGYWESMIVTAHMATGSLIISLATVAALRAWRSRPQIPNQKQVPNQKQAPS